MSGFWNNAEYKTTEYEQAGGDLEPIPAGTTVMAAIDEAKWVFSKGSEARHVALRWTVVKPEEFNNRKITQRLWIDDDDPRAKDPEKKRKSSEHMMVVIDTNSGGGLFKSGSLPTDEDLSVNLLNKPMLLGLQVWKMKAEDGSDMSGNWVKKVGKATGAVPPAPKAKPPVSDGEIPF